MAGTPIVAVGAPVQIAIHPPPTLGTLDQARQEIGPLGLAGEKRVAGDARLGPAVEGVRGRAAASVLPGGPARRHPRGRAGPHRPGGRGSCAPRRKGSIRPARISSGRSMSHKKRSAPRRPPPPAGTPPTRRGTGGDRAPAPRWVPRCPLLGSNRTQHVAPGGSGHRPPAALDGEGAVGLEPLTEAPHLFLGHTAQDVGHQVRDFSALPHGVDGTPRSLNSSRLRTRSRRWRRSGPGRKPPPSRGSGRPASSAPCGGAADIADGHPGCRSRILELPGDEPAALGGVAATFRELHVEGEALAIR